jgi:hypothetical protein
MPPPKKEKPEKPPKSERPEKKPEADPTPTMALDVALYHPKGPLCTIHLAADSPKTLTLGVDLLLDAGFTERRPFEVEPKPVTPEQLEAAARTAAQMVEAVAKAPTETRVYTAGNGEPQYPQAAGRVTRPPAEEKPSLDRAKANMEKAVAKAEGKPDQAEKERVKSLLAWWKDFLFVKNGGPTAAQATAATRKLKADEPPSVCQFIKEKAIDKWVAETGFEWDRDRQEWVAPKEPTAEDLAGDPGPIEW